MPRFRMHRRYSQLVHLYVIRHGLAEDARAGLADVDRQLTSRGERKLRRAVKGLGKLDLGIARVLASPWARAWRTAELLEPLARAAPVASDLLCRSPGPELLAALAEHDLPTAVVGHQPWLGELVAWLVLGDPTRGSAFELKKGSLAWLSGSATPRGMQLRALVPPKLARAL